MTTTNTVAAARSHKKVGEIRGNFFVPAYQRGYRWNKDDVLRLLEDVDASRKEGNQDYPLQPVVVRHRYGDEWELIDGQQRLTTLYLIFLVMKDNRWKRNAAPYSLCYETRKESAAYLQSMDRSIRDTNIDFHHLAQAYDCIETWFTEGMDDFAQETKANQFFDYLTEHVMVIWYEPIATQGLGPAEMQQAAIALFTRLNVGRIPLTDAELVKALLLTAVRKNNRERAQELAAQWDGIERDLQRKNVWAFISALDEESSTIAYPTRISLLLDTLADKVKKPNQKKRPRYHTFEILRLGIERDPKKFWSAVTALHAQIMGWMEDAVLHNKVGFLIATGYGFGDFAAAASVRKKSEFDDWLTGTISQVVGISAVDLDGLRYDNKNHYPKLMSALLLFNVEALSRVGQRFPFAAHAGERWSLEHIHAQQAEGLNKEIQWRTWLEAHQAALAAIPDKSSLIHDIGSALDLEKLDGEVFRGLHARIVRCFGNDEPDHSIRNLALLSGRDNSQLNNAVFEAKRQMVLALDRAGNYIPICTRHVFLKYYARAGNEQLHFWSDTDKDMYFEAITGAETGIGRYLRQEIENQDAA